MPIGLNLQKINVFSYKKESIINLSFIKEFNDASYPKWGVFANKDITSS